MRRHVFDPVSFVFGMVFATIGLAFLTGRVDLGDLHLGWIWPVPLIALGLALLLTAHRRDARPDAPAVASPPPAEPEDTPADEEPTDSVPASDREPASD